MLKSDTIRQKIGVEPLISSKMQENLQIWYDMYTDKQQYEENTIPIHSLGLPYAICVEKSMLATQELKSIVFDPNIAEDEQGIEPAQQQTRATYLNEQYQMFLDDIMNKITVGVALGTMAIKVIPNIEDMSFNFKFVPATDFFPISFSSADKLTQAVFVEQLERGGSTYTKLEHHKLENGVISVINTAYKSSGNSNDVGSQVPLTDVPDWAYLEPTISIKSGNENKLDRILVTMFTMPGANNVDINSRLGMSCFEPARKIIERINIIYSDFTWEFEGGALAIDSPKNAIRQSKDSDGNISMSLPKRTKRLFRQVSLVAGDDKDIYSVFNPTFRDVSYNNAINMLKREIEDKVSLSRGTFSDMTDVAKTATEIKMLKQRSYQSNKHLQVKLQKAFEDIVYIMDVLATLYNFAPMGGYATNFKWDDSILIDVGEELEQKIKLVSQGAMYPEEIVAWYNEETLEERFKTIQYYRELKSEYDPEIEIDTQIDIE